MNPNKPYLDRGSNSYLTDFPKIPTEEVINLMKLAAQNSTDLKIQEAVRERERQRERTNNK